MFREPRRLPVVMTIMGLLCSLFFFATAAAPLDTPREVQFAPAKVSLTGILKTEWRFGPPGFGENPETDKKITIFILSLDRPTTVAPGKNSYEYPNAGIIYGVDTLALYFTGRRAKEMRSMARQLVNKPTMVRGQLNTASAPMDFTEVTMDVSEIKGLR